MDTDKKKELRAAYKERPREAGVVFVTCGATGEMFLADVVDAPAAFNRMRFQLSSGLYPDKRLQALWNQHGESAFEFGVLQRLDPSDADADIAEELETLLDLCLAEHPEATKLKAAHGARRL